MVTPIRIPVNEPGPFTTIISSTLSGDKLLFFRISLIYLVTYMECFPGMYSCIWDNSFPSFTKAIKCYNKIKEEENGIKENTERYLAKQSK